MGRPIADKRWLRILAKRMQTKAMTLAEIQEFGGGVGRRTAYRWLIQIEETGAVVARIRNRGGRGYAFQVAVRAP